MRRCGALLTLLFFALVVGGTSHAARTYVTSEKGVDRPGQDYKSFWLKKPSPELCRQACADDEKCKAYTYVKPGVQGRQARCWLKGRVPSVKRNYCCVSGVKTAKSPTVAISPPVSGPAANIGAPKVKGLQTVPKVQARQFSPRTPGTKPPISKVPLTTKKDACDKYAKNAVSQSRENKERNCGFSGARWSSNYKDHFNWCMAGNNVSMTNRDNNARKAALTKCSECIKYSELAVQQNEENLKILCVLSGPSWTLDFKHHYEWCMNLGNISYAWKESNARKQAIVTCIERGCARSYKYLGEYPTERDNGWSENLQGVTNDGINWFFTQTNTLWKFPVKHDLNTKVTKANPSKGILKVGIPPDLAKEHYNHFGDLDYYKGYLFVPVEASQKVWDPGTVEEQYVVPNSYNYGTKRFPAAIFVFRAADLHYVGKTVLNQKSAGWCAINYLEGVLYTSESIISYEEPMKPKPIYRYRVHIQENKVWLMPTFSNFTLYDESGKKPLKLKHMQGGEFSANGCLYLVNGYSEWEDDDGDSGVMVFNKEGRRIARSTNKSGLGGFKYEYHPNWSKYEEPEGITLWDLDEEGAPNIKGQVHVIMLDNEASTDELCFKHYRILNK